MMNTYSEGHGNGVDINIREQCHNNDINSIYSRVIRGESILH